MNSKVTGEGDEEAVQKKSIAIFAYKQRLLSIEMKTKVVQHVPRINLSYLKFQIFKFLKNFKKFQIFSGSQLLSDFQTFFITQQLKTPQIPQFLVMLPDYVANHALFWSNFMSRITLFS